MNGLFRSSRKSEKMPLTCYEPNADLEQPVPSKVARRKPARRKLAITTAKKILVVDDDPLLCLGLKIRLKANDYNPCFALDGESAISTARTEMPDLIILDLGLPRGNGYFVMRSLSASPELARVPVIVLTARDGFTHEGRCREAGAKQFFEKPVNSRHLLKAIRQLME
jgi:DNA-binding response OmpR family regulator